MGSDDFPHLNSTEFVYPFGLFTIGVIQMHDSLTSVEKPYSRYVPKPLKSTSAIISPLRN